MVLWSRWCSSYRIFLVFVSAVQCLYTNVTSRVIDVEPGLLPPLKDIPPCSANTRLYSESKSRTRVPEITNNNAFTLRNVSSGRSGLGSWSPTPCFLATSDSDVILILSSIIPGGTPRQIRWIRWALRYVTAQLDSSQAKSPQTFQSDRTEIAWARMLEADLPPGYDSLRPALISGMRNLLLEMSQNGAAQFKGFYLSGPIVTAFLVAEFGTVPPPIPGSWPQPLPHTLEFFVPGSDSRKVGRLTAYGAAGDGWDTVHCSKALLQITQALEAEERQGKTIPEIVMRNTDRGEDIQIAYEPDPAYRGPSTLYMEIKFFKALQNVISQRGMLEVRMAFVDTSRGVNIGSGLIEFLDYEKLAANPSHANNTISVL